MVWSVVVAVCLVGLSMAHAAPFAYIANSQSGTVSQIDLSTNETISIPVGSYPLGTAATRDGTRAYVTNFVAACPEP